MIATEIFGDSDGIERLARTLAGSGSAAESVREVRNQVLRVTDGLVPGEWRGLAADAFAQQMEGRDIPDLSSLSDAADALGALLIQVAHDIRIAKQRFEHATELALRAGIDLGAALAHPEQAVIGGLLGGAPAVEAIEEFAAAWRIAQHARNTARHALASVHVPGIGTDTLVRAVEWGLSPGAEHPPADDRGARYSGLPPSAPRPSPSDEQQRKQAIAQVQRHCDEIVATANRWGIPPEAIAGAILWEALENPVRGRRVWEDPGPGPGKVHCFNDDLSKTVAEKAEEHGKVAKARIPEVRFARLLDPSWAIKYIGAILSDEVDIYRQPPPKGPGVDISQNVGVLLTLYEGGNAEGRAAKLAADRKTQPDKQPGMGDYMGPWVVANLTWVRDQLTCL